MPELGFGFHRSGAIRTANRFQIQLDNGPVSLNLSTGHTKMADKEKARSLAATNRTDSPRFPIGSLLC